MRYFLKKLTAPYPTKLFGYLKGAVVQKDQKLFKGLSAKQRVELEMNIL